MDCFFSIIGSDIIFFSSFFSAIASSACLIIFSVSFGRVLSGDVFDDGVRLSNKSPLETLSPTLTAKVSTLPAMVEGISTLDLSLSIVTIGSFSLI